MRDSSRAMSRAVKDDTAIIRDATGAIQDDTSKILDAIAEIRATLRLQAADTGAAPVSGSSYMVNRYLDSLTTYAETVADWATVYEDDGHGSVVSEPVFPKSSRTTSAPKHAASNSPKSKNRNSDQRKTRAKIKSKTTRISPTTTPAPATGKSSASKARHARAREPASSPLVVNLKAKESSPPSAQQAVVLLGKVTVGTAPSVMRGDEKGKRRRKQ